MFVPKRDYSAVRKDITAVVEEAREADAKVKVIFEMAELTKDEIENACAIATACDVDSVKTSTGFATEGADVTDLTIMGENWEKGIKISGGVSPSNYQTLLRAVAGARNGNDHSTTLDPSLIRIGESSLLDKLKQ